MNHNTLFLIGMRASGKTTLGRALAKRLGWDFADTDALVLESSGREVADIVADEGWEGFRVREALALRAAARPDTVVATGGGAILREDNRVFIRNSGLCVYLCANCVELCRRLARDPKAYQRPPLIAAATSPENVSNSSKLPLDGLARAREVQSILAEREDLYRRTAHYIVDASLGLKAQIDIVGGLALDLE